MSVTYKIAKNYTLPLSVVVLILSVVGLVLGLNFLDFVAASLAVQIRAALGPWTLWVLILSGMGLLVGGWYVGEQVVKRRKFERLIATDKRSDFTSSRKELDDLARTLPDSYRPRILEKEASFKSKR
jgi:hypothetical protein